MSDDKKKEPTKAPLIERVLGAPLIERVFSFLMGLVGLLFVLGGIGLFGIQIYGYLKSGVWTPFPVSGLIEGFSHWFNDPQNWIGLHRIVRGITDFISLSVASVFVGFFLLGAAHD